MKRFFLTATVLLLALASLPAQEIDLQMAVASQALNDDALSRLGVSAEDSTAILELQAEFRDLKEASAIELNVVKAQLAQALYYPDADIREVEKLLEQAAEIRLDQEKAQLRTYIRVRELLGEETWEQLMRLIKAQARARQDENARTANQNRSQPGAANQR